MEANLINCSNQGMSRDLSISKTGESQNGSSTFAYENHNLRITANNDETLLSITNEKGPSYEGISLEGTFLGHCIVGDYIVVFTKGEKDSIYRISLEGDTFISTLLYSGNLQFSLDNPIEALGWYESKDIQKVYWVDGKNVSRFINIVSDTIKTADDYQFDFAPRIDNISHISVEKDYNSAGVFQSGTIQYFVSAYNKYGAETAIIAQSDIQYISPSNRGGDVNETVSCGFKISIERLGRFNYDYVRIYSAYRATEDGPVLFKKVADVAAGNSNFIEYIDYNTSGETLDPQMLYFIGGQAVIASTLTQKDGTLFLGDLNVKSTSLSDDIVTDIHNAIANYGSDDETVKEELRESALIEFVKKNIPAPPINGNYSSLQQINRSQQDVATFKYGEIYRFGIQFMNRNGEWTSVVWAGDKQCNIRPSYDAATHSFTVASVALSSEGVTLLYQYTDEYVAYRLLFAETSYATRQIVAQGVVNPTLFNYRERYYNEPFSFGSWNFRPRNSGINSIHLQSIGNQYKQFAELQGLTEEKLPFIKYSQDGTADIENAYKYFNFVFGADGGHEMVYKLTLFNVPDNKLEDFAKGRYIITDYKSFSGRKNKGSWNKTIHEVYEDLKSQLESENLSMPISEMEMPTPKELRQILRMQNSTSIKAGIAGAIIAAASVIVIVASWGTATAAVIAADVAAATALTTIVEASLMTCIAASAVLGTASIAGGVCQSISDKDVVFDMAKKNYIYIGGGEEMIDSTTGYHTAFDGMPKFDKFSGTQSGSAFYLMGGVINYKTAEELSADTNQNQFYVDNSLITFNSPELQLNEDVIDNNSALDIRIIGTAPIQAVSTNSIIQSTAGWSKQASSIRSNKLSAPLMSVNTEGLLSDFLYQDGVITDVKAGKDDETVREANSPAAVSAYKVFLWNRNESLSAGGIPSVQLNDGVGNPLVNTPARLEHKIFANLRYSYNTEYFDVADIWKPLNGINTVNIFDSDKSSLITTVYADSEGLYYSGDYENQITFIKSSISEGDQGYEILTDSNHSAEPDEEGKYVTGFYGNAENKIYSPVKISYKETPHAVVSFKTADYASVILPRLKDENEWSISELYPSSDYDKTFNAIYKLPSVNILGPDAVLLNEKVLHWVNPTYDGTPLVLDGLFTQAVWVSPPTDKPGESFWVFQNDPADTAKNAQIYKLICGSESEDDFNNYVKALKFARKGNYLQRYMILVEVEYQGEKYLTYITHLNDSDNFYSHIFRFTIFNWTRFVPEGYVFDKFITGSVRLEAGTTTGRVFKNESNTLVERVIDGSPDFRLTTYFNTYTAKEDIINVNKPVYPYLYIAELYKKDFKYSSLYGGYSEEALEQLNWVVCSKFTEMGESTEATWGDTFYQRWDCLKSYPSTEADVNSIVDIFSFMVESHTCLDGRYDKNKGTHNILNARPSNWNLMNTVYNQSDNLFRYNILDEKFQTEVFENQIAWSESKIDVSDIDTWASMSFASVMSLDGTLGKLNKLLNVNDSIVAFQDRGMSVVNFNAHTAISTEAGIPLELAKTGKVNGYSKVSDNIGCHNKWSIQNTPAGVFFIDDYNKSFYMYGKEGLSNLSSSLYFERWFKENINGNVWSPNTDAFKSSYDKITGDLYITDDDTCLVYNTKLQIFVSFMSYEGIPFFGDTKGSSFLLRNNDSSVELWRMFSGRYNHFFGEYQPYSMEFRLNPSPYTDNLFTNFTYVADWSNPDEDVNSNSQFDTHKRVITSFDKVVAFNEYQKGELDLTSSTIFAKDLKKKFRIWKGNIPRDGDSIVPKIYGKDRMRNPWIHLKLIKEQPDDSRMVFHNMTVTYYK